MAFKYRPRTAEDVKEQADQNAGNFDAIFKSGFDTYRPEDGENVIRFCPPTWKGARHYALDIWVHYNVGPRNGTYLCLKKMLNKRCPICDAADDAARHGEKADSDNLIAKKRKLAWVIDRDDNSTTPKLWNHGWTLDQEIGAQLTDRKSGEVLQIDDPDNGYDVSFKRKGGGKDPKNTKYVGFQIDRDPSPMFKKQRDQDDALDFIQANLLPDTLKYYKAEYLEELISGTAGEDDDDDDAVDTDDNLEDDDMVERTRSKHSGGGGADRGARSRDDERNPRSRDRDDDQEIRRGRGKVDEDEEEDQPVRRGRGKVDEDEDEDDQPVRRGRGKVDADEDDRPVRRGRGKVDEDEDDADDDYDADTDDEADRPARRTISARDGGSKKPSRVEEVRRPKSPPPREQSRGKSGTKARR